jgi:hypothetical protein
LQYSGEVHSIVDITPWKELLTPIEEDDGWSPKLICAFLLTQNLSQSCWEWNPAPFKSHCSYCTDYATSGTLSLETLFTHDARQQFPLRNITFSKQKKLSGKAQGWMARQEKNIITSYSLNPYPVLVEECVSFRLPYGGDGPQI